MKGKIFVGRSRELEALHKSLKRSSQDRAMLVAGNKGMGKSALMDRFWSDLRSSGSPALWINLDRLSDLREPTELTTALVQSLDGSTSALQGQVASFAQSFGRAVFAAERKEALEEEDVPPAQRLASLWTEEFLQAFPLDKESSGKPLVYVAIDNLDQVRSNLLDWFVKEFVEQWQERDIIGSFRFLATSTTWPLGDAPLRYMESVSGQEPLLVRLEPLTKQECNEFARKRGASDLSGDELFAKTNGIPGQLEDELEMHSVTRAPFPAASDPRALPEGLTEGQTHWIARAASLPSLSIEGLTLFYDRKEATEVFNWLRYAAKVTKGTKGQNLDLDSGVRQAALTWFRKKDPAGAQAALNRGERFADFQVRVPTEDERRMLLLLSHFLFFDEEAVESVVGDRVEDYLKFVKARSEWFLKTDHNFQMLPEYRDLCMRFRELVGENPADLETRQRISTCWERKKQRETQRRDELLSKQSKLREEMSSVDSQGKSLASAREKILAPAAETIAASKGGKKRREVKIGTSFGFLALGVIVLGLSLGMRDLFTPYHAAAGIFLTLAGFFWPIVTNESPAPAMPAGMDQFAVETQMRVLQFRLNGLETRRARVRERLGNVHRETRSLEDLLDEPYLLDS